MKVNLGKCHILLNLNQSMSMLKGHVLRLARLTIFLESDSDIKFYKHISDLSESQFT